MAESFQEQGLWLPHVEQEKHTCKSIDENTVTLLNLALMNTVISNPLNREYVHFRSDCKLTVVPLLNGTDQFQPSTGISNLSELDTIV